MGCAIPLLMPDEEAPLWRFFGKWRAKKSQH
jgi:hypothetical protein